jgi:DNA-binding transcriptional MerR regulator
MKRSVCRIDKRSFSSYLAAISRLPSSTIDSNSVTVYNKNMQEHKSHLTIEELAEQVDIPVRTIRYYIAEGLLPGPEGRGKATTYGDEQLQRLRLIRLLSHQRMPLAEMYHLLNRLALTEVYTLLAEENERTKELEKTSQPPAPQEYIATLLKNAQAVRQVSSQAPPASRPAPAPAPPSVQPGAPVLARKVHEAPKMYGDGERTPTGESWQRWELAPGVELHIKEGVEEQHRSLIERICKVAGMPFQREHK